MTKNRDEQRRLYVLEHAPVEYLKEARAMLARPEKFSAEAIVDALKRTAKFSPKGRTPATSTEPVADDRQALFAAGGDKRR